MVFVFFCLIYFTQHNALKVHPRACKWQDLILSYGWIVKSMGLYGKEHWSGLPFPSPGDLPNPGSEPTSFASPALAGRFFTASATWEVIFFFPPILR